MLESMNNNHHHHQNLFTNPTNPATTLTTTTPQLTSTSSGGSSGSNNDLIAYNTSNKQQQLSTTNSNNNNNGSLGCQQQHATYNATRHNKAVPNNNGHINNNNNNNQQQNHQQHLHHQPTIMRNMDDKWIVIQKNTFTNWVNEQLKVENERVADLKTDLSNGVRLIKLVNRLQQPNSKIARRYFKTPTNQHQCLENVSLALNAITDDGIKLVNIGNTDLANGNLKLILGLIWHLILRYQIGKTKIPPKKLILAWIKSVLPNYHLTNLTEDLNDGIIIAGLVNYCNPSLFPDWLSWDKSNKLDNCTKAMNAALNEFEIPLVVTPLNMSSPELDELSAITYLSYFIREGSPGYRATLKWVQSQIQDEKINNFNTDWNDGWLLCKLATKMGIQIEGFPNLDRTKREANCQKGLAACRKLKIEPYVTGKELADPEVESIAVMATVVQFKYTKPIRSINEKIKIYLLDSSGFIFVGQPFEFRLEYLETETKNIKAIVKGPKSTPSVGVEKVRLGILDCHFIPGETGRFELNIICDDELVDGCPIVVNVKTDTVKIQLVAEEKFTFLNEPIEICINPMGAGRGTVVVVSKPPSGKEIASSIEERDSKYYSKIFPNEPGTWVTRVFYDDSEIQGSPYTFDVYDLNLAEIEGLASINTSNCPLNKKISFNVNVSKLGRNGQFSAQLVSINPLTKNKDIWPIDVAEIDTRGIYSLGFTPIEPASYKCILMFNNKQLKGSPIEFNAVSVDTSQLMVDFHKCKSVLVNHNCSFMIDTKESSGQGDVKVVITTPTGAHHPAKLSQQGHSWKVDFTPNEIGEYYVDIFYANQLITGSPFKCNVFDPTKIKITPTHTGVVDQVVKFEVDASQAGTGQLEIAVENGRIPCNFSNQGNLRFVPSFTPREAGKHEVTIKFNQHDVPGSPFYCTVVDLTRVALVNQEQNTQLLFACFKTHHIELNSAELAPSLNMKLIAPSGLNLPLSRSITPYNTMKVVFQPNEIGTHSLEVDYLGQQVQGSPFELKVYDAARILVSEIRGAELNKPCELSIDATSAGEGQLEIAVNDGLVKNQVKPMKPGHYGVVFVPTKQDQYLVDIKFNNEQVPGCPKQVFIKDHSSAKLIRPQTDDQSALLSTTAHFDLAGIHSLADLSVRIKSPAGQEYTPKIHKTASDECRVEWIPYELGTYTIEVVYCEHQVKGCPLKVKTYDPKRVIVYSLQDGFVFKPNVFCVDAGQAGEGSLEIGISNSQGQYIPNQVKPLGNSKFEIQFLPQEAQMHYANISFNSEPVKGSPFPIKIVDTNLVVAQGKGLTTSPINQLTSFSVIGCGGASSSQQGQLKSTVTGPKGESLYLKLYQQANGDYVGEYTPLSTGQHRIDIYYSSQALAGSPYLVQVFDPKLVDILQMPKELIVGQENLIEVDYGKCGAIGVELELKVSGATGVNVPVSVQEVTPSHRKFTIVPNELGTHRLTMQIAGHHVASSPISLNCVDFKLPTARGDGLHHGLEDKPAYFYVDSQGMSGSLEVNIEGPQHFTKNQIERQSDGSYIVKYTPVEVGLFKIFVKWSGREIPGSPFISYVVNPEKIKIVGGWQSILDYHNVLNLRLYEERTINFDTSEAGPGTLSSTILAPNNAKLPLRLTNQNQIYSLAFTALYEGEYTIHLMWDNHPLPNTPILGKTSQQSDLNKIEISGYGLHEAKINAESDFIIDGSRAGDLHSLPEIKFTGTRCDIDVRIMQIGHNIYRCVYVPQIPGAYLLNVKWNDRQVGDSPYKVNIGMNSDPSKVIVSGEGIKMGIFGQDIKALIDTRRAGPGELTAHCMGPQKVAFCEFFDHKDGTFTLFVKPQEPGKHVLQVKYNDEHVPGSAFVIKISGPPDASKVRVYGPGICHGVLNKFKSKFVCETKGAGAGQLTVRIRGPKGAFRVEMQRESQKDRTIFCKFDPTESGDYQINVKWSGQHVPGSPFNVHIFNNDDELDQFLRINPEASYAIQQQQLHHHLLNI